jgi:hypothetical protein
MTNSTLEVVRFSAYARLLERLPLSKRILQVVFCEAVQHRLNLPPSPQLCQNGGLLTLS